MAAYIVETFADLPRPLFDVPDDPVAVSPLLIDRFTNAECRAWIAAILAIRARPDGERQALE
jgi:hypothetical protein